jgi:hypothetical protein
MVACGISMYSCICIVAPYLGTLAETHEGCGVGAKPEDGVWWNFLKMKVLGEWCLTNTDLVLDPRQAPDIISLLISENAIEYYVICIVALSYKY